MHKAASTSRFLIDISSGGEFADSESIVSHNCLLQQIVASHTAHVANWRQVLNALARRSIRIAEHAFSLRDVNTLEEASRVLVNLPLGEARQIGRYYHAIAISRIGQADEALSILEAVADNAPVAYRARAIQTLGSIHHRLGRHDEALRLYHEALRLASPENGRDLLTTLLVHLDVSCIKSELGDHRAALTDYQSLSPLVRIVAREDPFYFYGYHNELAIEFAESGRLAEAEAASAIALASPFAHAYPEWSETRDEIAAKRDSATPSVVAIARATEAGASQHAQPEHKAVRVSSLAVNSPERTFARKDCFQRSLVPIAPQRAIAQVGITKSILERVLCCIAPRAPPALS
jgi:tetratricopeptide (TPR) repeat protein